MKKQPFIIPLHANCTKKIATMETKAAQSKGGIAVVNKNSGEINFQSEKAEDLKAIINNKPFPLQVFVN